MAKTASCKITIKGGGLTFEQEIPVELGRRLVAFACGAHDASAAPTEGQPSGHATPAGPAGFGAPVASSPAAPSAAPGQGGAAPPIGDFIKHHQATRQIEVITAIGEYLSKYRNQSTFSSEDLREGYESASLPLPGALARDVMWATNATLIAKKRGERGHYYVTDFGRRALAGNFGPEFKEKTQIGKGKRKPRRGKSKKSQGAD